MDRQDIPRIDEADGDMVASKMNQPPTPDESAVLKGKLHDDTIKSEILDSKMAGTDALENGQIENAVEHVVLDDISPTQPEEKSQPLPEPAMTPPEVIPIKNESTPTTATSTSPVSAAASSISTASASVPESTRPTVVSHKIKWIRWTTDPAAANTTIPIVTQNENGPCPLLALVNVLFLRGQAKLPSESREVSSEELLGILHDCVVRMIPQELSGHQADYQRNIEDAVASLPKLMTGIDVNVRFTGVDKFEYTPDCLIFDLLNIPLYHGWLVEPERGPIADAVGQHSYNQLIEFIIDAKSSDDQEKFISASLAQDFLDTTATQLTYRGLCELNTNLKDGALCVFFRNNHFSTLLKHDNELFCLVTDQGFLNEPRVVWESLNSVDGDSRFVDVEFRTVPPNPVSVPPIEGAAPLPADASPQEQVDHDLMLALSLAEQEKAALEATDIPEGADDGTTREERDLLLAMKLQEEENQLAAQEQRQGSPSGGGDATASVPQQRHSPDSAPMQATGRRSSGKKDKCSMM